MYPESVHLEDRQWIGDHIAHHPQLEEYARYLERCLRPLHGSERSTAVRNWYLCRTAAQTKVGERIEELRGWFRRSEKKKEEYVDLIEFDGKLVEYRDPGFAAADWAWGEARQRVVEILSRPVGPDGLVQELLVGENAFWFAYEEEAWLVRHRAACGEQRNRSDEHLQAISLALESLGLVPEESDALLADARSAIESCNSGVAAEGKYARFLGAIDAGGGVSKRVRGRWRAGANPTRQKPTRKRDKPITTK